MKYIKTGHTYRSANSIIYLVLTAEECGSRHTKQIRSVNICLKSDLLFSTYILFYNYAVSSHPLSVQIFSLDMPPLQCLAGVVASSAHHIVLRQPAPLTSSTV